MSYLIHTGGFKVPVQCLNFILKTLSHVSPLNFRINLFAVQFVLKRRRVLNVNSVTARYINLKVHGLMESSIYVHVV